MLAKLVTANGDLLESVVAYDAREIKIKLDRLAKYTARQGLQCRVEAWFDRGERAGELCGYFGPQLGLQAPDCYRDDWYMPPPTKSGSGRPVGRPKGDPKPPKQPRERKHPEECRILSGIYLLPAQIQIAKELGGGNISAGIRIALDRLL